MNPSLAELEDLSLSGCILLVYTVLSEALCFVVCTLPEGLFKWRYCFRSWKNWQAKTLHAVLFIVW